MKETYWLGLHKTGTTFLQKSLDLSQAALQAGGIDYLPLQTLRDQATRPFFHTGATVPPPPRPAPGSAHRLIFDENILAVPQAALAPDALYPDAAPRARAMADHLGLQNPTLVLGLRSFASYLPSLYCEVMKAHPFRPFSEFFVTRPQALSWADLVARLSAAFPASPILVYRAEQLRGAETRLLSRLLDLPPQAFTLLDQIERQGFSGRAIKTLAHRHGESPVTRAEFRATVRKFPRGADYPAFSPWSEDRRQRLDERYARDLDQVARLPNVTMLDLGWIRPDPGRGP